MEQINTLASKLPEKFVREMKVLLNDEYDDYIKSLEEDKYSGLRVNELKISTDEFLKLSPYNLEKIPWTSNGYYFDAKLQPSKNPLYFAGLYYIQEPSAMTPANVLPIEKGDYVLDLCAAPGGKSTEIANKLKGSGLLVSNDISPSRVKALIKNIEIFGIKNSIVMSESPKKLEEKFKGLFDKIIIDAPCSGEGMFRKTPSMIKSWEKRGNEYFVEIQKEILQSAVKMLKNDGFMVYSTCTFSKKENEDVIEWLLNTYSEMELINIPKNDYFSEGIGEIGSKVVRLWPHKLKGEGHFVALLHKKQGIYNTESISNSIVKLNAIDKKALELYKDFESKYLNIKLDPKSLVLINEKLYLFPGNIIDLQGLRVFKTGWYLGNIKKNRFEPSQSFAIGLKKEEVKNIINFTLDQIEVIKYLKGETLNIIGNEGYNLVCVEGYPLGWAKKAGKQLKNKYNPNWRLN